MRNSYRALLTTNGSGCGAPVISLGLRCTGAVLRANRIVGREADRELVAGVMRRARAGSGGVVVISGAAGLGKSTLVGAATSGATDVVVGRATPPPAPALRPLCELASALVRRGADPEDDRLRVHRRALGLLAGDVGDPLVDIESASALHLADAVIGLAGTTGPRAPSTLVIEDLHWADQLTCGVVESLADGLSATRFALVVTLRPEGLPWEMVRRIGQRRSASLVELSTLPPDDVRALVVDCLGADPPPGLLDALAPAGGVPLLVEEMLSAYEQRGDLERAGDAWRFEAGAAVLPASVGESVAARLDTLAADDRGVVEAAALLGREFDAALLPPALATSPAAVDAALRRALALGLLAPEPGAARLHFAHALVRDAVLASATNTAQADMALRLLAAIDARYGDRDDDRDLERRAGLAITGGQRSRAAGLLERAGRRSLDRGFPSAAVGCFEQALALCPPGPGALGIREALLQALVLAGDADRAAREGAVVRRQLAAIGAGEDRLQACLVAVARAAANAGRWEEASVLLAPARDMAFTPAADALHSLVAFNLGRFTDAEASARRAAAEPTADPAAACEAGEVLGRLARRQDLGAATRWFEFAAATAELHGLALWQARALHELATIDQLRTLAVDGLAGARDAAIAAGAPGLLAAVDFHLAAVHGVRFERDAALAAARRCLDTARRLGAARQEAWAWNLIGQAHAVGGDRVRARAAATEALELADDPEITGVAVGTARGLGSLLADDRDRAMQEWVEAIAALRRLPSPTPLPPWYLWPLLATVYDLEGDGGERARSETDIADLRVASGADGLWHLAAAVAHGRAGDLAAAEESRRGADERFALVPAFAGFIHLGRRVAAEAALADGWGHPGAWLQDAATWFDGRGFDVLAKGCRSLGRRAGVPQRRQGRGDSVVPPHLDRLGVTSREVDVLRLLAGGLTNREIAERLYVSPRTVKGHVESLLAKTATANRTQLAGLANGAGP